MILKLILIVVAIGLSCAETPVRAPYPAAGWRPQVPFNLPSQYRPRVASNVEISRERIEHAGTFSAPEADFNQRSGLNQPNAPTPDAQYGAPVEATFSDYLPPTPQSTNERAGVRQRDAPTNRAEPATPEAQYGTPADGAFRIDYPDEESAAASEDLKSKVMQGRYYIVAPDNKLQRVLYRTVPNDKETDADGFTAQLRYSSVGQLQDPVYKYNTQGQLERVLK